MIRPEDIHEGDTVSWPAVNGTESGTVVRLPDDTLVVRTRRGKMLEVRMLNPETTTLARKQT